MAKWKRDAEAFYKENSAMLENDLHTVEANIVCSVLPYFLVLQLYTYNFRHRQRGVIIKVWQQH